jgi:hypothetical protein
MYRFSHSLLRVSFSCFVSFGLFVACDNVEPMFDSCLAEEGVRHVCVFPWTPELDGELDEEAWELTAQWQTVHSDMGPEEILPDNDTDASYEFACLADENNMYFAFRVRDDIMKKGYNKGSEVMDDDSIELYISQHSSDTGAYDKDDSQIIIGADSIDMNKSDWGGLGGYENAEEGLDGYETNTQVHSKISSILPGWQTEMAVPLRPENGEKKGWSIFLDSNLKIGFSTAYNDDDDENRGRDHKLIWSKKDRESDDSWKDTRQLGELLFCSREIDL